MKHQSEFADNVMDLNKVLAPSRASVETHEIHIYPDMAGDGLASFEDVSADFNVVWDGDDAKAEFVSFKIGSLTVTRAILCEMLSRAEVDTIEQDVSVQISEGSRCRLYEHWDD